jgi:hypothetical protein
MKYGDRLSWQPASSEFTDFFANSDFEYESFYANLEAQQWVEAAIAKLDMISDIVPGFGMNDSENESTLLLETLVPDEAIRKGYVLTREYNGTHTEIFKTVYTFMEKNDGKFLFHMSYQEPSRMSQEFLEGTIAPFNTAPPTNYDFDNAEAECKRLMDLVILDKNLPDTHD